MPPLHFLFLLLHLGQLKKKRCNLFIFIFFILTHATRHGGAQEAHRNTVCIPTKRIKISAGSPKRNKEIRCLQKQRQQQQQHNNLFVEGLIIIDIWVIIVSQG